MKTIAPQFPSKTVEEGESSFESADGTHLFYRWWQPPTETNRGAILLHRGHEHSGRLAETARVLCGEGMACFAYDARGHGRSPGRRGDAPKVATLVRDLDAFVRQVRETYGLDEKNLVVIANSVASVVATAWVHDYAPGIRGLVLVAPAFSIKLYVPLALPALRATRHLKRDLFIKSYVRPSFLTHDRVEARRYAVDRLIARDISAAVLVELDEVSRRLIADAGVIETPTLILSAGSDFVVRESPQRAFYDRLGSAHKRFIRHAGMRHALLHEQNRAVVVAGICGFITEAFAAPNESPAAARDADHEGSTAEEFRKLSLAPGLFRGAWFAGQRAALKIAGGLSEGLRIGWRHGFDSGRSLDYIYENRARGTGPIGRRIDRAYLDAPGWRGIRQRRELLESMLRAALRMAGEPEARVVDIASGPGRYVLEVLQEFPQASAVLSDWCEGNVQEAQARARAMSLKRVTVEKGDAFDEGRLSSMEPKADIVIVSGLYELFPDNALVKRSLQGVVNLLKPGGRLIYTNQPTHPQLEMIARVLRNREGKPWIMRRRSQSEMDALVRAAGLEKERTVIDDQGIFTVSTARKEGGR